MFGSAIRAAKHCHAGHPNKKECVAELVGPGCAQPEHAQAVGLDALIGIVQASCERALTDRVAECGKVRRRFLAGETPGH